MLHGAAAAASEGRTERFGPVGRYNEDVGNASGLIEANLFAGQSVADERRTVGRSGHAFPCCTQVIDRQQGMGQGSADVERLGAGGLAIRPLGDHLDLQLGLAQQRFAMGLELVAAFVDLDGFLERHITPLELADNLLKLLQGLLEGKRGDFDGRIRSHAAGIQDRAAEAKGAKTLLNSFFCSLVGLSSQSHRFSVPEHRRGHAHGF